MRLVEFSFIEYLTLGITVLLYGGCYRSHNLIINFHIFFILLSLLLTEVYVTGHFKP